jgi:hypothetical protein
VTASIATVQAGIKTFYPQDKIEEALLKRNTAYGVIKKRTDWEGSPMHIAATVAPTAGGSRVFATAQANIASSVIRNFAVTHANDYSVFRLETSLVRATGSNRGALMNMIKAQGNAAMNTLQRSIGISMFRNHGGARGVIESGADTVTLQLADPRDAVNFEQGMVLVSSNTDGTSGSVSANSGAISAIDYTAGTLTAAAQWHADFDTSDFLFRQGDFGVSLRGFASWLPAVAPTGGDSFFGLDRSQNSRLYGVIFDADAQEHGTLSEYLIDFSSELGRLGSTPDTVFVNPRRYAQLQREMAEKTIYDKLSAKGSSGEIDFSYKTIKLQGDYGEIDVLSDINCPYDRCYMLQLDTWTFWSMQDIGWLDDDKKGQFLRTYNQDSMEARLGGYMQLVCEIPGYNGTGDLSAIGV